MSREPSEILHCLILKEIVLVLPKSEIHLRQIDVQIMFRLNSNHSSAINIGNRCFYFVFEWSLSTWPTATWCGIRCNTYFGIQTINISWISAFKLDAPNFRRSRHWCITVKRFCSNYKWNMTICLVSFFISNLVFSNKILIPKALFNAALSHSRV